MKFDMHVNNIMNTKFNNYIFKIYIQKKGGDATLCSGRSHEHPDLENKYNN